ncbi:uncharacterized protein LOC111640396 [Centruroides sculpturatus]|uniref:uncharacterized protein LOC111640396 n=1 Tax=Centruroides sculpturatus TaxID=218467 RepID=UPI000C6D0F98|nr:uncharacterized protein LOC111640396 [Centruroides sculpturatus]
MFFDSSDYRPLPSPLGGRLVEDKEEHGLNNNVMVPPTKIEVNKDFRKQEDSTENSFGYNIGYSIGYTIGCAIRDRKALKKAGSFFKAVWKPVKRSAQKVWKNMKTGETEYVQFE